MNIVDKAVKIINKKYKINKVDVAIVVGSGLIDAMPEVTDKIVVKYDDIGLPKSKVQGHSGSFVFGDYNGKKLVFVSRMHFYESGSLQKVRMPLEICAKLGVKQVVLLTSSGSINQSFKVGDVMLIDDHINLSGVNPLVGIDNLSFTNMTDCYNSELRKRVMQIAADESIILKNGIFVQMSGPSYETLAEIKMIRSLGGDAVSMSTAHDCIIANYLNMSVVGFSVIVNECASEAVELTHAEVLENAAKACAKLKVILSKLI
ncbi:MAG: purine-nucleoside phosphorylase [Clostridia bacterium]|nr:purine-nucleoside phosphorylase [Clostridia bacterium]